MNDGNLINETKVLSSDKKARELDDLLGINPCPLLAGWLKVKHKVMLERLLDSHSWFGDWHPPYRSAVLSRLRSTLYVCTLMYTRSTPWATHCATRIPRSVSPIPGLNSELHYVSISETREDQSKCIWHQYKKICFCFSICLFSSIYLPIQY